MNFGKYLLAAVFFFSVFAASNAQTTAEGTWKEGDNCVRPGEFETELASARHPVGPALVKSTFFLPADGLAEFVVRTPFKDGVRYFGFIKVEGKLPHRLKRSEVTASRVPADNGLVTKKLAEKDDTLIAVDVPKEAGSFWNNADLFIYTCEATAKNEGTPKSVSVVTMRTSDAHYSGIAVWTAIILIYVLAAFASRAADVAPVQWYRYLDPVYMTAGNDGKGSLSKLQILFFTFIVAGLLAYIVARNGVLSEISNTILLLMGIAGAGSTIAKATDVQRNRLDPDNAAWLIQRGWLPKAGLAATNKASWRDIVTTDGEFDVYRFQIFIFSLIVGVSLFAAGISQLASFDIPSTLLGIMGLSQVVYVGGKLATPTTLAELNTAISELRAIERKYIETAFSRPDPQPNAGGDALSITRRRAGEDNYKEYVEKAQRVNIQFHSATGRDAPANALQPPTLP